MIYSKSFNTLFHLTHNQNPFYRLGNGAQKKLDNLPKIPIGPNVSILHCFSVIPPEADLIVINIFNLIGISLIFYSEIF